MSGLHDSLFVTPAYRRLLWPEGNPGAYAYFSAEPEKFSAILEDPKGHGRQYLCAREGNRVYLDPAGEIHPKNHKDEDIFSVWRAYLSQSSKNAAITGIRCLIYTAYEMAGCIESMPAPKTPPPTALLWLLFPEWSICFDPKQHCVHLCAQCGEPGLDVLEQWLRCSNPAPVPAQSVTRSSVQEDHADTYREAVMRVKAYIQSGDVFQANIARFWHQGMSVEEMPALYHQLRSVNPAPFSSFFRVETDQDTLQIISASPERLFQLHADGMLETRPIAGTRKRAAGLDDVALTEELLLSEKERAEHIMLVDLERNDMGRVCVPGSIEVNEQMVIERYSTVQHIVSNIRGRLAAGMDVVDIFQAMFPGGTITGCPKVRCMEIIHELEQQTRGPYTGGVGYIAWDGSADINILIRSFWHHHGQLHWAAGAGIVADSTPEFELKETEHKVSGLIQALS